MVEQLQRDVYPILLKPKSIYIANTSETLKTINVISTIACWEANCRTICGVHNFLMRLYILEFGCILVDTGNNEPSISKGATSLKTNMQWKISILNRSYVFKWLFFPCHVGFRGCSVFFHVTIICQQFCFYQGLWIFVGQIRTLFILEPVFSHQNKLEKNSRLQGGKKSLSDTDIKSFRSYFVEYWKRTLGENTFSFGSFFLSMNVFAAQDLLLPRKILLHIRSDCHQKKHTHEEKKTFNWMVMLEFEPFKDHGESQPQEGRDPLEVSKFIAPAGYVRITLGIKKSTYPTSTPHRDWGCGFPHFALPCLKLTGSPLQIGLLPQKERIVFQPSISRCELLVSGRVIHRAILVNQPRH